MNRLIGSRSTDSGLTVPHELFRRRRFLSRPFGCFGMRPGSSLPPSAISRTAWRRLLLGDSVPRMTSIAVVGAAPIAEAAWLSQLPCSISVCCEDVIQVAAARMALPHLDVYAVAPNERPLLEPHSYDLLVMLDVEHGMGNRLDLSSRLQTARWLTALRPQGRIAYLQRTDESPAHRPECWVSHLACFPGQAGRLTIIDSWATQTAWQALSAGRPRPRTEWLTSQRACCDVGAASAPQQTQRKAA